jgi:hypothetical protein
MNEKAVVQPADVAQHVACRVAQINSSKALAFHLTEKCLKDMTKFLPHHPASGVFVCGETMLRDIVAVLSKNG